MAMKKMILLSLSMLIISLSGYAQDDLYFTPKKSSELDLPQKTDRYAAEKKYGNYRDIDEYNRRTLTSSYKIVGKDSLGNDIIEYEESEQFNPRSTNGYEDGMLSDADDYEYSRRMGRFDGFYGWYDPYFYGYRGWHSPYWYGRYYGWYDPWYTGWYDPWYTGYYDYGFYGWGRPYRPYWRWGGWYGYDYPHYGYIYRNGRTGTTNHGRPTYRRDNSTAATGTFGNSRSTSFGNRNQGYTGRSTRSVDTRTSPSRGQFGGSRTNSSTMRSNERYTQPQRSTTTVNSGSFGGSRSSGGGFGGSRSGGSSGGSRSGGGFGGRR
ncbi:MAG: hypothetical protein MR455_06855 [Prevotella sp.]|nr:hypothetical protein [Prevotella sp.]MDY2633520.1 hypothetical protein [Prevotella sp.]